MLPIIAIILLSLLSGITTLIGVILAYFIKKNVKLICAGIGFSAGIMLFISFLELLPEAAKATSLFSAFLALILGILFIASLNFIIPHTHFVKEKGKLNWHLRVAYLVAFGLILHDFPEGFAMANSYILAPRLGLLVALSIAIHNIPEEFAMAIPLVLTKKKKTSNQVSPVVSNSRTSRSGYWTFSCCYHSDTESILHGLCRWSNDLCFSAWTLSNG